MTNTFLDHWTCAVLGHALCDSKNSLEHDDEVANDEDGFSWSGNAISTARKFTNTSSKLPFRSKVNVEEKTEDESTNVHVVVFVEV